MSTPPAQPPVVLFDGVCNLCHQAVQWILAHDRQQVIRFASLQSQAGEQTLRNAGYEGPIPDSVVLVHEGQVYLESDAMLELSRLLGFPWSLGLVFKLVPRFVRNPVYRWIAGNRYRWFGKKDSCPMPKPEWTGRFLDSAEDVDASVQLHRPARAQKPRFATRWLFSYWWIYILPFPFALLPFTDPLWAEWTKWMNASIGWFADTLFGHPLTVFANGSGDTTANYFEVLLDASLAVACALALGLLKLNRQQSERAIAFSLVLFRYYLASVMFTYGLIKLFPLQMPAPGPDRLMQPIGEASPMGFVWTFVGVNSGYQMFSGLFETLAGLLLVFRRTALLGALCAFGVMLNVSALNYFFDVPVKLFSTHLVLLALLLAAPELPRLCGVVVFNLPARARAATQWTTNVRWRAARIAALLLFAWGAVLQPIYRNYQRLDSMGPWAEPGVLQGVYEVTSFASDDPEAHEWLRFGIGEYREMGFGGLTCVWSDGSTQRQSFRVMHDTGQLTLFSRDFTSARHFAFELADNGTLTLTHIAMPTEDGTAPDPGVPMVEITAQRLHDHEFPLTSRPFRWINEYPDNR